MFLLNLDNRITFWSTGAEQVFGWSERALLVGGELRIGSQPGTGTTVYLSIPLRDIIGR